VQRLETAIGHEARRRNADTHPRGWRPRLSPAGIAAAVALAVVSMAIGGVVVAAAYQAQDNERRDALGASLRVRADAANLKVALAKKALDLAARQHDIGTGTEEAVLDARLKVQEAEAAARSVLLDIEEVRLTAREPLNTVAAPLVSGRDFVSERWRVAMTVPMATLDREAQQLQSAERRADRGLADKTDIELLRLRIQETEAGLAAFRRRLEIRQRFVSGEYDAAMADLRVTEADAEQRLKAVQPKLELARQTAERIRRQADIGTATQLQLIETQLAVKETEVELERVRLELLVVQKQIADRRNK